MVAGHRGGVVGAIAAMGVIVGTNVPMFIGAMVMGPLGGWCIKKWDDRVQDKIRQGFEMLVNNFSAGIIGMLLAIVGFFLMGPIISGLTNAMAAGVDWIINHGLLWLANIFIEPAKILFLNNAINQGILTPLGIQAAAEHGKSILFLLEPDPGPGLGVLLAFALFGKGAAKGSAPSAIIIHFLGDSRNLLPICSNETGIVPVSYGWWCDWDDLVLNLQCWLKEFAISRLHPIVARDVTG